MKRTISKLLIPTVKYLLKCIMDSLTLVFLFFSLILSINNQRHRTTTSSFGSNLLKLKPPLCKKEARSKEHKVNFKNFLATVSEYVKKVIFLPFTFVKNLMNLVYCYCQKSQIDRSSIRKSMKHIKNGTL